MSPSETGLYQPVPLATSGGRSNETSAAERRGRWRLARASFIASLLVIWGVTALNIGQLLANRELPAPFAEAIAPSGRYNVVGMSSTLALFVAGWAALFAARLAAGRTRRGIPWWVLGLLGCGLLALAAADSVRLQERLFPEHIATPALAMAGTVAVAALLSSAIRQRINLAIPRWLLLSVLTLVLLNPLTALWKEHLISDSANYAYVAPNQPWRFKSEAARDLYAVDLLQETSEAAVALLLLWSLSSLCMIVGAETSRKQHTTA